MAEISSNSSIASIVEIGTSLGNTLGAFISSQQFPNKRMVELISEINSTTNALRQVEHFIHDHQSQSGLPGQATLALKDAGYQAMTLRVGQCETVFRTIVAVVTKAGLAEKKKKFKTEFIDTNRLKITLLTRDVRWSWLRPRVKKIQEQIVFLKLNLLLLVQVASLAKYQLTVTTRVPGMFEEELAMRSLVDSLKRRRLRETKSLARKYKPSPVSSASSSVTNLQIIEEVIIIEEPPSPKPIVPVPVREPEIEIIDTSKDSGPKPPPYSGPPIKKVEPILEPSKRGGNSWPPPPPASNKVIEKKEKVDEVKEQLDEKEIIKSTVVEKNKDVEFISMSSFKQKFGKVDSWFKGLFGPSSLFFDDIESESIEAFMILGDKKRLKVPFGHRRLKFGMKKLMKAKKESTLDDYYSLPKHLHGAISQVLQGAKIVDSRERIVVCFDALNLGSKPEDQHLLVFFAVNGAPLEPIHFKDAVGRKFDVPFHLVPTWEEMKAMVNQAFLHVEVIGPEVYEGHYDLIGPNGAIILPTCWEGTIKPGMKINMHMWPMDNAKYPRPPMWNGPPRPPGMLPSPFPRPRLNPVVGPGPRPGPGPGALPFPRPLVPIPVAPGPMGRPGLPPPLPPIAVAGLAGTPKKKVVKRRSYSTISTYRSTDSSDLGSDSDIENEETDLGVKFDYEKEKEEAATTVRDLLVKWTNAIDVEGGQSSSSFWSSSDSSDFSLADD